MSEFVDYLKWKFRNIFSISLKDAVVSMASIGILFSFYLMYYRIIIGSVVLFLFSVALYVYYDYQYGYWKHERRMHYKEVGMNEQKH